MDSSSVLVYIFLQHVKKDTQVYYYSVFECLEFEPPLYWSSFYVASEYLKKSRVGHFLPVFRVLSRLTFVGDLGPSAETRMLKC